MNQSTDKVRVSTGKVRVNDIRLNESQQKIVTYVVENNKITNREVCDLLQVKDSRALKILKELNHMGILKKEGSYRDSCYRIAEKINFHV